MRDYTDASRWLGPRSSARVRPTSVTSAPVSTRYVSTSLLGKPEPLKHLGGNVWARRINEADRLGYEVFADRVEFLQARSHC